MTFYSPRIKLQPGEIVSTCEVAVFHVPYISFTVSGSHPCLPKVSSYLTFLVFPASLCEQKHIGAQSVKLQK